MLILVRREENCDAFEIWRVGVVYKQGNLKYVRPSCVSEKDIYVYIYI
jgi:hypothetical protein